MPTDTFVQKTDKLPFYGVPGTGSTIAYHRMRGFDKLDKSDNPVDYARTYIDENTERTDIVGYAPEISCSFDQIQDNAVHDDILSIVDDEVTGSAAVRSIVVVDLTNETEVSGTYTAKMRNYTVVGDSESRENYYNRSVNFKANGDFIKGTATTTDGWQTLTFTADED